MSDNKLPIPKSRRKDGALFYFLPSPPEQSTDTRCRYHRGHREDRGIHTGIQVRYQEHRHEGKYFTSRVFLPSDAFPAQVEQGWINGAVDRTHGLPDFGSFHIIIFQTNVRRTTCSEFG